MENETKTEKGPMTREEFTDHWNTVGILGTPPSGLSLHPEDGEALVEARVITEAAIPESLKKRREEKHQRGMPRSYTVFGMGVSFVPGIPKGTIIWVGRYNTVMALTRDGKLVTS